MTLVRPSPAFAAPWSTLEPINEQQNSRARHQRHFIMFVSFAEMLVRVMGLDPQDQNQLFFFASCAIALSDLLEFNVE